MKKSYKYILFCIIGIWLIFTTIVTYKYFFNKLDTQKKEEIFNKWKANPIWNEKLLNNDFISRIKSCNENYALEFINLDRKIYKKHTIVLSGKIEKSFLIQFSKLYNKWPSCLKNFAEKHISKVYIVKNLGSSSKFLSTNNKTFVIFIDERIMFEKPNVWFNRKEGNCLNFKGTDYSIKHVIERDSTNTAVYTFEDNLIHELGHCVGVKEGYSETSLGEFSLSDKFDFYRDCYKINKIEFSKSTFYQKAFEKLKYYSSNEQMSGEEYFYTLNVLKNSSFPTTYSTLNNSEFFAEYFFSYVHCIIQKRIFQYRLYKKNKLILSVDNGILNKYSTNKYTIIEKIFKEL